MAVPRLVGSERDWYLTKWISFSVWLETNTNRPVFVLSVRRFMGSWVGITVCDQ